MEKIISFSLAFLLLTSLISCAAPIDEPGESSSTPLYAYEEGELFDRFILPTQKVLARLDENCPEQITASYNGMEMKLDFQELMKSTSSLSPYARYRKVDAEGKTVSEAYLSFSKIKEAPCRASFEGITSLWYPFLFAKYAVEGFPFTERATPRSCRWDSSRRWRSRRGRCRRRTRK